MKAALMDTERHHAFIAELETPTPETGEVLVASRVVGLCRSDIELLHGHLDTQLPVLAPIVPGHEWSGVVTAVGANVGSISVGERVVGECVIADNHWFGFSYHGAASEQFAVPARLLHSFPPSLSFADAALIEPFTIAFNAIKQAGGLASDQTAVIIGAGMIGLACTAIVHALHATAIVIEPSAQRAELATRMGASRVLNSATEAALQADLVIEASGSAAGIASSFEIARIGGRIVNIGICADPLISAPLGFIQSKNLNVRGVTGSAGVWPEAIAFLLEHNIDLSPTITATFDLQDLAAALAATASRNVKVQLVISRDE